MPAPPPKAEPPQLPRLPPQRCPEQTEPPPTQDVQGLRTTDNGLRLPIEDINSEIWEPQEGELDPLLQPRYTGKKPEPPFGSVMIFRGKPWVNAYGGLLPEHEMYQVDWPWYTAYRDDLSCISPRASPLEPPPMGRTRAHCGQGNTSRPQSLGPSLSLSLSQSLPPLQMPTSRTTPTCPERSSLWTLTGGTTGLRRYWHHGAKGQGNPRGIRAAHLEVTQALAPDEYPRPIVNLRKQQRLDPPPCPLRH